MRFSIQQQIKQQADKEPLNDEEKKAVRVLNRLAKTFPKSLWLCSIDLGLYIMKPSWASGKGMMDEYGNYDREAVVEQILGIKNDGGGW